MAFLVLTLASAFVCTLFFESPFIALEKMAMARIMGHGKRPSKSAEDKTNTTTTSSTIENWKAKEGENLTQELKGDSIDANENPK